MKKKNLILIFGSILIAGIGGLFYYRYMSSPEYSLKQITKAYDEHDFTLFEKYVDTKTLLAGILDRTLSEASERSSAASNAEKLGENLGQGLVNLMRPQIEAFWTQQIQALIETGKIEGGALTTKGLNQRWFNNDKASFKQIKEIKKDGKIAMLSLEFSHTRVDTALQFEIKMRDKGNYWQLFDITDILDFSKHIEDIEEKRVHRLNEVVKKEFLDNVKLSELKLTTETHGNYARYYSFIYDIILENRSNKVIDSLTCIYDIMDSDLHKLKSCYVKDHVNHSPGQKYIFQEIGSYSDKKINPNSLTLRIKYAQLSFKDGSKIKWNEKWEKLEK